MADGVARIRAERQRQRKRWGSKHDANHMKEQLALAAACYALPPNYRSPLLRYWRDQLWPQGWDYTFDDINPERRIRALEKAGALIAAEIDRLVREYAEAGERK